jgi:hypothetical protein
VPLSALPVNFFGENPSPTKICRCSKVSLDDFPVVVLTGPRQVGKSTLLQQEFPGFAYVTLDDFGVREKAQQDPALLWLSTERIVLDEVQKAPALLEAVKLIVDRDAALPAPTTERQPQSSPYLQTRHIFLLSGSANLLLMKNAAESLAGRAGYLELLPFTYGEVSGVMKPDHFSCLWQPDPAAIPPQTLESVDPIPHLMHGAMPPFCSGLATNRFSPGLKAM